MWLRGSRMKQLPNRIEKDSVIKGDIQSDSGWEIAGVLRGNLLTHGDVTIDENAEVFGDVKGDNIQVKGKVTGNIAANRNLMLYSTCITSGDIVYEHLVVEEGALFSGRSLTVAAAEKAEEEKLFDAEEADLGTQITVKPLVATPEPSMKNRRVIIQ